MAIEEAGFLCSIVLYRTFRRGAANENKDVEFTLGCFLFLARLQMLTCPTQ